jgi:hypothetical protein
VNELNLLEHYIKEIHSEKEIDDYPNMIEVDVTSNCWGSVQRSKHITSKVQWQIDVEKGYYLA